MALETQTRKIDDHDVNCTPHKARAGARLLARLVRHVGPALAKLRGLDVKNVKDADIADFGPAVAGLAESLTPDEFDSLTLEILSRCSITMPDERGSLKLFDLSKPVAIDDAFSGELKLMFKVMAWALEVNFGNFFDGFGQSVDADPAAAAAPSPSP